MDGLMADARWIACNQKLCDHRRSRGGRLTILGTPCFSSIVHIARFYHLRKRPLKLPRTSASNTSSGKGLPHMLQNLDSGGFCLWQLWSGQLSPVCGCMHMRDEVAASSAALDGNVKRHLLTLAGRPKLPIVWISGLLVVSLST